MLVSNLLLSKEELTLVSPDETINKALELIKQSNTLSIPVANGNKFYGSISKAKIYEFLCDNNLEKDRLLIDTKVEDLMRTDISKVTPNEKLEDVIPFLEKNHIPFVAVVDKYKKFRGIITYKRVFKEFTQILGINKGKRICIITRELKGQLSKITKIIHQNGGDVISAVVINPQSAFNLREITIRIRQENFEVVVKRLKEAGFNVQV